MTSMKAQGGIRKRERQELTEEVCVGEGSRNKYEQSTMIYTYKHVIMKRIISYAL